MPRDVIGFGAPVGFRPAARHPEWIAGLVVPGGTGDPELVAPDS
ncbi:hypothetical protein ACWY4P_49725 [Streptomyces sp. LZ34]